MQFRDINFLVKPTLACNARCIYCHSLRPSTFLSDDLLIHLFSILESYSHTHSMGRVTMNWHGGEPMVMGPQFYRRVMKYQREYAPGVEFEHVMQTNASLYCGETRETLREFLNGKYVGVCFDPFHPTRPLATGEDSLPFSLEGTLKLIEDGFLVSMIYVVHKKSLGMVKELYNFFRNTGSPEILFHPVEDMDDPGYALSAEDFGVFLIDLWEIWEQDGFRFHVDPIADWRRFLLGGPQLSSCEYGTRSKGIFHLVISPEGNLYPCHRFQDKDMYRVGNLRDMTIEDMILHPFTHWLYDKKSNLSEECVRCEFVGLCNGGCVPTHGENGKTVWCEGLTDFYKHISAKPDMAKALSRMSSTVSGTDICEASGNCGPAGSVCRSEKTHS